MKIKFLNNMKAKKGSQLHIERIKQGQRQFFCARNKEWQTELFSEIRREYADGMPKNKIMYMRGISRKYLNEDILDPFFKGK
jgi:hypothetical protein